MTMLAKIQDRFKIITDNAVFKNFITIVIIINSAVLGLATSETLYAQIGGLIEAVLSLCVFIFTVEIIMRIVGNGWRFFLNGWNVFDFVLVSIALVPESAVATSFRVFRVLRALRMLSSMKKLRHIISAIIVSAPHVFWATVLLMIIFYVFGIMGQNLFHENFPQWFGTLGDTIYTLFQVTTLESWSMGIARPVMEIHSWAWCYFVPFVLMSSYIILNVVVGVVVNAVGSLSDSDDEETSEKGKEEKKATNAEILKQITKLREEIERLEKKIDKAS